MEMYWAWNLTDRERLTLHYDSAKELGQLQDFRGFFSLRSEASPLGGRGIPIYGLCRYMPRDRVLVFEVLDP